MNKIITVILIGILVLTGCQTTTNKQTAAFKIGVIQWGEHPALMDSLEGMKQGLETSTVMDKVSIEVKNANEDASNASMIASQFVNDKVDLIFAIATPAAQTALTAVESTDIPVVFAAVSDASSAGLVENTTSPEGNITGVSDLPPLEKQVTLMKEMLPELKSVGILFNTSEVNGQNQIKEVKKFAAPLGIEIIDQGVSTPNEVGQAASQLASQSDASFIVNDNMIASATGLVVESFGKHNKPVFMAESGQFDQGIFASDSVSYLNLGKQAGVMIHDILFKKTPISALPVQTAQETSLIVSQTVADKLKITIPQSVIERAEVR